MGAWSQLQQAEDQFASWSLMGRPHRYGTNAALLAAALAIVQNGFTGQGLEILTPTGSVWQEFLIYVPKPSKLLLLMIDLILMVIVMRRRALTGVQAR